MKESKPKRAVAVEAKAKKSESKAKLRVVKEKPKKRQAKPKVKKDPNQPKRPPTAFFVFLEEFRQTFKQKHPEVKGVAAVGKACGDKWKEMSEAEKAPYLAKAAQKKADYDVSMTAYKKKQVDDEADAPDDEADAPEESDKSKSELNEDDDDEEDDSEDED